jgi:hypothetical protein
MKYSAHHRKYQDRQIHFYTLPSLDPVPPNIIKPIRNVVTFAVDHQHLKRPPPSLSDPSAIKPIDFCVIKRSNIALYSLRERLVYRAVCLLHPLERTLVSQFPMQEIPLPSGATLARRSGRALCVADRENYNMIDLERSSFIAMSPLSQAPDPSVIVKPLITVVDESEFLIGSWTGFGTIGIFVNGDGDPVRGTLQWPAHPQAICMFHTFASLMFALH